MPLRAGEQVELVVDKPASGGRMIGRYEGEVVLVAGAAPAERVLVRIARAEKRVAFADVVTVLDPSPDRRASQTDPACGGCGYAHIKYDRQLLLKGEIIRDAFLRIGKIPVDDAVVVEASPERGYRMRARFHVQEGRPGFYREGTHELCDPRQAEQVLDASVDAVEAAIGSLSALGVIVRAVEVSENVAADQRAMHLELHSAGSADALERAVAAAGLTGCTARAGTTFYSAGDPIVSDPLHTVTGGRVTGGYLRRHPEAFFQANRHLLASLTGAVLESVTPGHVIDLYAGVGLFAVSLGAAGAERISAVEGDPVSSRDLLRNAAPYGERLRVFKGSVEAFLGDAGRSAPGTVIVDPPRTGMSREAAEAVSTLGAARIVYVSCDAPTMARDARRLLDAGYRLVSLRGFDLFPNTPHVEALGVFERS